MINLNPLQLNKIKTECLLRYPEEMVGAITQDDFFPFNNVSTDKESSFSLTLEDTYSLLTSKEIIALAHSHTLKTKGSRFDIRTPSYNDIINQKKSGIPWLIFGTEGVNITSPIELPRIRNPNYIGREFIWFINDCYTLTQDFLYFNKGIETKDSIPPPDFKRLPCMSGIFDLRLEEYGFKTKPANLPLNEGDICIVDSEGFKKNHLAIFHQGKFLHQKLISGYTPFETFLGHIHCILYR